MMEAERKGLEGLSAALDLAVFEQTTSGVFRAPGPLPAWLELDASSAGTFDLVERFPMLEIFLEDCCGFFETGAPAQLDSEIWEEAGGSGQTLYLQARAVAVAGRRLLVLKLLPRERYTYQQLYHDFQLAEEEARRLKDVAERATRAKGVFLATMSHEIRTPLNAIIGMADVLASSSLTQDQRKCVEVLGRNGVNLLDLVNDILDLAKVESGKIELEAVGLDPIEVVERAVEVIEGRARAKGLDVRRSAGPGVPACLTGDPGRLRQVLINLLGNAIKFTARGHVEIRIEQDPEDPRPGSLRFAVSDTGIGIPEDKVGRLFESFVQADSSTTREYGGTGLGLSISKQLVELMSGRIWVESRTGQGSIFFFTAKLAPRADPSERAIPRREEHAEARLERRLDGLRILLADDSDDNRFLIESYLKQSRCSIEIATNGQEAVERFRAGRFDAVLMDVEMPVMDGCMAAREIRHYESDRGLPATPVLALTAHAFAEMEEKSRDAGFTAHLVKPIRKVTLLEALAGNVTGTRPASPPPPPEPGAGFVVHVEPGMEDVVPGYLEKRRKEIQVYQQALAGQDFETLIMMGHKMKGTGTGYGFPALTELGGAIEQAARRKDTQSIGESLNRFTAYVENIQLEYSR